MRLVVLATSSAGNATLVETPDSRILIDCGFPTKRIAERLEAAGTCLEELDAVFVTHEHSDHCAGLEVLAKRADLPVFANRATALAIGSTIKRAPAWTLFETGTTFRFRDLEVKSLLLPHDAVEPVGFVFRTGSDDLFRPWRSVCWLTDLGHATPAVRAQVQEVDVLVLESNHCPELLEQDTKRPWQVKQRIKGRHGHLSNAAAREFMIASTPTARWQHVFLAHLSQNCNDPALVRAELAEVQQKRAEAQRAPLPITVIPPTEGATYAW